MTVLVMARDANPTRGAKSLFQGASKSAGPQLVGRLLPVIFIAIGDVIPGLGQADAHFRALANPRDEKQSSIVEAVVVYSSGAGKVGMPERRKTRDANGGHPQFGGCQVGVAHRRRNGGYPRLLGLA